VTISLLQTPNLPDIASNVVSRVTRVTRVTRISRLKDFIHIGKFVVVVTNDA
jgi:hypothetical protein